MIRNKTHLRLVVLATALLCFAFSEPALATYNAYDFGFNFTGEPYKSPAFGDFRTCSQYAADGQAATGYVTHSNSTAAGSYFITRLCDSQNRVQFVCSHGNAGWFMCKYGSPNPNYYTSIVSGSRWYEPGTVTWTIDGGTGSDGHFQCRRIYYDAASIYAGLVVFLSCHSASDGGSQWPLNDNLIACTNYRQVSSNGCAVGFTGADIIYAQKANGSMGYPNRDWSYRYWQRMGQGYTVVSGLIDAKNYIYSLYNNYEGYNTYDYRGNGLLTI